ncbi:MAG: hypothetical protein MUO92_05085, partial [Dehalococcoidales bacterium]|nr:hypothetical protein [Dehalococcoidales bacterium]
MEKRIGWSTTALGVLISIIWGILEFQEYKDSVKEMLEYADEADFLNDLCSEGNKLLAKVAKPAG